MTDTDQFDQFKLCREPILPFATQVTQYPQNGEPDTIELFLGDVGKGRLPVNCLLWRNHDGLVRGILNHYPQDYPPLEQAGNINVFVHPDWKRRGIGTALMERATELFGEPNFEQQIYSPEGMKFLLRYRRRHGLG